MESAMNIRAKIYGSSRTEEPILRGKQPKGAKSDELNSVVVPREESRRCNNRDEDRHRLSEEAVRISRGKVSHEAQLINLSGGGAMLRGSFGLRLWDSVELHLGDHGTVECAVRWIRDDRIGLEFAHETRLDCPTDEVASVLREVISRSFPDARFERPAEAPQVEHRPSSEEGRGEPRHPLIWSGVLHHDYQSTPVRVRNISSTGAMIECSVPVRVGAEPLLELNDEASVSASVQWVVGDEVGLKFHTPFDMRLLARSKPEVAPSSWVRPAYLEAGGAETDNPWDPRWNRLTLRQLSEELEGFLKR
jgi:hypothetical protein